MYLNRGHGPQAFSTPNPIACHGVGGGGGIEWSILEHIDSVLTLFTTDDQFIERSSLNTVLRPAIDELFTSEKHCPQCLLMTPASP